MVLKTGRIMEQVDKMLDLMKQGVVPWKRDWSKPPAANWRTKRPYSGFNVLILSLPSDVYNCPFWDTFRGIRSEGGRVRTGEKGTQIIIRRTITVEEKGENGEKKLVQKSFMGCHTVFNLAQTTLSKQYNKYKKTVTTSFSSVEDVINSYQKKFAGNPVIRHGYSLSPCYKPNSDIIELPEIHTYTHPLRYEVSRFHELIHSTGHSSRLNRNLSLLNTDKEAYSKEELVAEIGSVIALGLCGVDTSDIIESSASYAYSWHTVLRQDKAVLMQACTEAFKAAYFLVGDHVPRRTERESEDKEDQTCVSSAV